MFLIVVSNSYAVWDNSINAIFHAKNRYKGNNDATYMVYLEKIPVLN